VKKQKDEDLMDVVGSHKVCQYMPKLYVKHRAQNMIECRKILCQIVAAGFTKHVANKTIFKGTGLTISDRYWRTAPLNIALYGPGEFGYDDFGDQF